MSDYFDNDDGLPGDAFTELEREAGVPGILRGRHGRRSLAPSEVTVSEEDCISLVIRSLIMLGAGSTCQFEVNDPYDTLATDFDVSDLSGLSWQNISSNRFSIFCHVGGDTYSIAAGTLMNALRHVGTPLFTSSWNLAWVGWSSKSHQTVGGSGAVTRYLSEENGRVYSVQ